MDTFDLDLFINAFEDAGARVERYEGTEKIIVNNKETTIQDVLDNYFSTPKSTMTINGASIQSQVI